MKPMPPEDTTDAIAPSVEEVSAPDTTESSPPEESVEASGAPGTDAETTPEEEATPTEPEYDWAAWDGEVDSLSESLRPAATGVSAHYEKQMEALRAENAELQKWTDLFKDDDVDPAIAELNKTVAEHLATIEATKAERDASVTKYTEFEAAVEAEIEAETQRLMETFEREHGDLLKDDDSKAVLSGLIDLGADPSNAAVTMKMGVAATEAFIDAKADGASDALAMKFARMKSTEPAAPPAKPVVSTASRLTAGARPSQRPAQTTADPETAKTLKGSRHLAIARTAQKHGLT